MESGQSESMSFGEIGFRANQNGGNRIRGIWNGDNAGQSELEQLGAIRIGTIRGNRNGEHWNRGSFGQSESASLGQSESEQIGPIGIGAIGIGPIKIGLFGAIRIGTIGIGAIRASVIRSIWGNRNRGNSGYRHLRGTLLHLWRFGITHLQYWYLYWSRQAGIFQRLTSLVFN